VPLASPDGKTYVAALTVDGVQPSPGGGMGDGAVGGAGIALDAGK
jgi:hypothetical protein